jgi:hypothetical protein
LGPTTADHDAELLAACATLDTSSALAAAYHALGLPDPGRPGAPQRALRARQPVDVPHSATRPTSRCASAPNCSRAPPRRPLPLLRERTPVRMDLTHSGWSDIFFLGMDFPEGARVLNVSIDLGVRGRDAAPRPPVEAYLRVIDEPCCA